MNNKKGISLIVLVITILVMIILAGVVIVSLQNDNPINKAKYAKMVDSVQSVRASISQYAATAQASDDVLEKMGVLVGKTKKEIEAGLNQQSPVEVYELDTTKENNAKIKAALGVDPSSVSDFGIFSINIKTGVSTFKLSPTGKGLVNGNTLPDGITE